jgi:hypothetical protein
MVGSGREDLDGECREIAELSTHTMLVLAVPLDYPDPCT